jgi:starch synthase
MKIFEKMNQTFGFTQTEQRVVLVLLVAFMGGLGIKLYKSVYSAVPRFDYSAIDSEFTARSQVLPDSMMTDETTASTTRNAGSAAKQTSGPIAKVVNINGASKTELCTLPGIGEVMAERIITYRKEHGLFTSTNDLMKVKGIGKKKFERLLPYIVVEK